jgi:hypothetical protein
VRATGPAHPHAPPAPPSALVLVLGFAILLTGLIGFRGVLSTVVGVTGFVVMVGALLLAMTAWKRLQPGGADLHCRDAPDRPRGTSRKVGKSGKPSGGGSGGIMSRLEERWKRRWDERGRGDR